MEVPAAGKVKKKRTKVADFTFTAGQHKDEHATVAGNRASAISRGND